MLSLPICREEYDGICILSVAKKALWDVGGSSVMKLLFLFEHNGFASVSEWQGSFLHSDFEAQY